MNNLITALLFAAISVYGGLAQEQKSSTLTQNDKGNNSQAISTPQQNSKTAPKQQNSAGKLPPWWETPEGWLAVLGIPTLGLLYWQAKKTHDAAEAARLNAESTAKQVDHLLASVRPWLLVSAEWRYEFAQVVFKVRNTGRSPARIIWRDSFLPAHSAIKYRNTFDNRIHESRFCYRISRGAGVIDMDGPYGYNQNT